MEEMIKFISSAVFRSQILVKRRCSLMRHKRIQQIVSGFVGLVLMLSLFVSPAYGAGWDTSAGGDGDFGEVGS